MIWALGRVLASDSSTAEGEQVGRGDGGGGALFGHAVRALRQVGCGSTSGAASRTLFLVALCQACEVQEVPPTPLHHPHLSTRDHPRLHPPPQDTHLEDTHLPPRTHAAHAATADADVRLLAGLFPFPFLCLFVRERSRSRCR